MPSYSGGRDQENHSLKPAQANNVQDSYLEKNPSHTKKADGVAQGVDPEFKPQYWGKKKLPGFCLYNLSMCGNNETLCQC
jgi:hypothetical protein